MFEPAPPAKHDFNRAVLRWLVKDDDQSVRDRGRRAASNPIEEEESGHHIIIRGLLTATAEEQELGARALREINQSIPRTKT